MQNWHKQVISKGRQMIKQLQPEDAFIMITYHMITYDYLMIESHPIWSVWNKLIKFYNTIETGKTELLVKEIKNLKKIKYKFCSF